MFVINCSAHPKLENLKSITLHFFSRSTTSVFQPMDQGIIYNLKTNTEIDKIHSKGIYKIIKKFYFSVISLTCFSMIFQ